MVPVKSEKFVTRTVCLLVLLLATTALADEAQFSVTSFKPTRLTDLRWSVDGNFTFATNDDDGYGDLTYPEMYRSAINEYDYSHHRFSASSSFARLSQDTDWFWNLGGSVRSQLYHTSSHTNEATYPFSGSDRVEMIERDYTRTSASFSISGNTGRYLWRDLFGMVQAQYSYGFDDYPTDNNKSVYSLRVKDFQGYIQETIGIDENKRSRRTLSHDLTIGVELGYGRIYDARFATSAMQMIEQLRDHGLLVQRPNNKQLTELTELIYRRRLETHFDTRVQSIEAVSEVMDYLKAQSLLRESDWAPGAVLFDVWLYYPNEIRDFGWRLSVGVYTELDYYKTKHAYNTDNTNLTIRYHPDTTGAVDTLSYQNYTYSSAYTEKNDDEQNYLDVSLAYYRPLDLRWQFEAWGEYRYYLYDDIRRVQFELDRDELFKDQYAYELGTSLEFLADLRTSVLLQSVLSHNSVDRESVWYYQPSQGLPYEVRETGNSSVTSWQNDFRITYRVSLPTTLIATLAHTYARTSEAIDEFDPALKERKTSLTIALNLVHYLK